MAKTPPEAGSVSTCIIPRTQIYYCPVRSRLVLSISLAPGHDGMQTIAQQNQALNIPPDRWTESFLDGLRQEGDSRADEAIKLILKDNETEGITRLFSVMDANDETPPEKLFPIISDFFRETDNLPPDIDLERIHRGEDVFEAQTYEGALALLTKCLPEGYQAPNLTIILNISGDLRTHTYRRLLGTLQTVVNVSTCRGFQARGRAVITAQKLRLLHAGIRHLTRHYRPDYASRYGVPVNQEDMLGTVLGFSLLVIEGWRTLNVGLTAQQEEDFLYVWLVFARMMGVHPPLQHDSAAYVPTNLQDATIFYRTYERRHYVDGSANPDGLALAGANLAMLNELIPWPLRLLGFGILPRLCMTALMGNDACARLCIPPVRNHPILRAVLLNFHRLLTPFEKLHHSDHERLGMIIFQDLIKKSYDGQVTFTLPTDMLQLKTMMDQKGSPA